MKQVHCDFETRSTTDLKKAGVYKYVEDPNTDVWCMAWSLGLDKGVNLWLPGYEFPSDLLWALAHGYELRAWNAQFERLIWNTICVERHGFPYLRRELFFCTQADAFAMGLPGTLDKAAEALRLSCAKNMPGNKLAKRMSKPRSVKDGVTTWWDEPEKLAELYDYCKQDVVVEMAATQATRRLGKGEREVYLLDQTINDRGVAFDNVLATACREVALEGVARANAVVAAQTDGGANAVTQVGRIQSWLEKQGCNISNLQKNTVREYLKTDLSPGVRAVLLARSEAGKSSISKIDTMFRVVCADIRLRGLLQYHGAATGRWAGRLVQPQNFPRPDVENVEYFIPDILKREMSYDLLDCQENPVAIVSSLLRSLLVAAPGKTLLAGDFSAIEARVLAWLAEQQDLVKAFSAYDRGAGKEVYALTAEQFNVSRYIGKVVILGAGYGMGGDKFLEMGTDSYGINFDEITAPAGVQIEERGNGEWLLSHDERQYILPTRAHAIAHAFIRLYRARYAEIPKLWYSAQDMMLKAVRYPGSVQETGRLKASFRDRNLWLILPSGRPLCYWYPSIVARETPWGETRDAVQVWSVSSQTKQWHTNILYGGLIVENAVQALARDALVHSMKRVTEAGYPIVATVHDEIIAETAEGYGSLDQFIAVMSDVPPWADGLPIAVSGWTGKRYKK